jgi:peptide-methionine (R)-S-oxide reductase
MGMLNWNNILQFCRTGNPQPKNRVEKTKEEWKALLPADTFQVTRLHGTERAFSSEMCVRFEPGTYACACCEAILFDGSTKYDSGTGWPSFTQPADPAAISYIKDSSFGMVRVETLCNCCDAHLGHVFPDGPAPSGLRYCMNAVALKKID